ncbi:MAG: cadherin repeat domain-containing protein, partial [Erysipelotrichaceae bacterium]|nr:cadherin repeat domain-containing protein [Erysipelotrichaceae bacterium]
MKRLIVVLTMLMITITVGYAYCNSYLSAASSTYTAGGNITGRIGPAGNGGAFSKGDRLITDISHNGTNIDWLLLNNSLLWRNNESGHYSVPAEVANTSNGMYAISFDSIMNIKFRDSFKSNIYENAILSTSNLPPIYKAINTAIDADSVQKRYLVVHTLDMSMDRYDKDYVNKDLATMSLTDPLVIKYVFPQSYIEFDDEIYNFVGRYGHLENQDRVYKNQTPYISGNGNVVGSDGSNGRYVDGNGAFSPLANSGTVNSWISEFPLRIAILFNLSDVVFAVSDPSGSSTSQLMQVSNIDKEKLSCTGGCNYTSLYDKAALHQPMKIRLLDNVNLNVDFDALTDLNGTATSSDINSITKGKKLKLFWSNKLSYTGDDYVSVLIEKQNTSGSYDFVYYKNISKDPNGSFEIDTSNFEIGSYRISLVDETVSAGNAATYSSQLKSKNINVVEYQPHTVSFTKKTGLEYGKNVNAGDSIGDLKLSDTVTTVFPITYTLDANGDNSYQNFEIDGLDSNQASGAKSLAVKIKANAPDLTSEGLKAGVYKFCVVTQDADGMPASPVTNKTKICTSVSIDKTNLTAAFDDPNQTKKSIADASTVWNETATANPNTGAKVTYSVSGGDVSLITIDPDTGAIAYQGNNAFGKVKIKATTDDDPSTGNDNYNPSFVEKEIVIYREVDGSVTPHTNSSSTTAPTFTSSDSNVKVNGIIGTIKGTLGTPDTIGGSTTTYRYGIKPGVGDANFFSVDSNTGVIKTTATSLGVKSYSITVTVSDNWSTKEIPITINVGVAAAENLRFYETSAAVNMITTKSVKATDTGVSVFATVKGSSNTNPVTYKIKDGSTNVIEVNPNSGAITIHGVGSVIIVAEKQGASGQANASTELSFTVTAGSQNFIYTDNAGNELPKSGSNYSAKADTYAANKTIQLYTAGNPTGSSVTYQLKAGSPT